MEGLDDVPSSTDSQLGIDVDLAGADATVPREDVVVVAE